MCEYLASPSLNSEKVQRLITVRSCGGRRPGPRRTATRPRSGRPRCELPPPPSRRHRSLVGFSASCGGARVGSGAAGPGELGGGVRAPASGPRRRGPREHGGWGGSRTRREGAQWRGSPLWASGTGGQPSPGGPERTERLGSVARDVPDAPGWGRRAPAKARRAGGLCTCWWWSGSVGSFHLSSSNVAFY